MSASKRFRTKTEPEPEPEPKAELELALELARRGCHLALSDIDAAGLTDTADAARRANASVRITTARVDTADRAAVYAWADQTAAQHGRVNLVFNNAGVALSAPLEQVRREDFEWLMAINFWGVVWGTQAFLPHLRASGDGHVVNTSSLFGLMAMPLNGSYNASKFAVRGYTEALRMELELGRAPVSATCVHPGGVRTRIARSARMDASTAMRVPKISRAVPEWAASQLLRRWAGLRPLCSATTRSLPRCEKRASNRACNCGVRLISGTITSTWACASWLKTCAAARK